MSIERSEPGTDQANESWLRRYPRTARLILALSVFVLFDYLGAQLFSELNYRISSDLYHHDLGKNKETTRASWGGDFYHVQTNSLGFKDRAIREVPLAPEGQRLLLIGDSFTEGVGVEHALTFAGLLQDQLAPRGISVLNAGVNSYCPIIYYRKVKYLIETAQLKFDRLVVLIDISDIGNELLYELSASDRVRTRETNWNWYFKRNSVVGRLIGRLISEARLRLGDQYGAGENQPKTTGRRVSSWTFDDSYYESYGREGLQLAGKHMTLLDRVLDEHGIALTVVVYPWPDQIVQRDLDSRQVRFWESWSAEHGAQFVNGFPWFINDQPAEQVLSEYFIQGDVHWNPAGHELVADRLLTALDRQSTAP